MFKKKPSDLLKSIKTGSKEPKKKNAMEEIFVFKGNETFETAGEVKTLDSLMGNLIIQNKVKFAESITHSTSELKNAFIEKPEVQKILPCVFKHSFGHNLGIEKQKIIEKIFSYNSKQYFIAMQDLSKK